ncbi:hypothetical protein BDA99DRAFT_562428 [Phascolomyces articulosus]|uniref:Uncharacterized protein n=1 Tax=Phascolomyces articulosus TaxID=60185 RepID=A0AAD5PBJ4_9FUNG|nr:hypothetical protein BDA99DRAFT_562428 [Phascolomyces articulosus]
MDKHQYTKIYRSLNRFEAFEIPNEIAMRWSAEMTNMLGYRFLKCKDSGLLKRDNGVDEEERTKNQRNTFIKYLFEASQQDDESVMIIADAFNAIIKKLPSWTDHKHTEDTFGYLYLNVFLDHVFCQSSNLLLPKWASSMLFACKNGEANIYEDKFEPDFTVYTKKRIQKFDLLAMEMKKPNSLPGPYSDMTKLGKEMKLMTDDLALTGVSSPKVCGMLVQGEACKTFRMNLQNEGVT